MAAKAPKVRKAAGLIVTHLTEKVDTKHVDAKKAKKEKNILLVVLPPVLAKSAEKVKVGVKKQKRGKKDENLKI